MITVVVANLKGGTSKTTTSGFLTHALYESGRRVLAVDADPQGTLTRWQETADWPITVIRLDSPKLHRNLPEIIGNRYDAIVIDTPPSDPGIVASAFRLATHIVIPMAPTPGEYERLNITRDLIEEASALREDGPPIVAVLLTRAVAGAASTGVYRELTAEDGFRVLRTQVGRLERFSQAIGAPVNRASASAYGDALAELLAMTAEVAR